MLLVEDERMDQRMFERMVERMGLPYDYVIASSVDEAKEVLRLKSFDVVILDYFVKGGTAEDLYAHVGGAPVIVATGGGDEGIAASALKAGAVDYLIKGSDDPFTQRLPHAIEKAVSRRAEQDKLAMLSQAMLSISDSVYISDQQGRITFVNPAFVRTYGYDQHEVIGMAVSALNVPVEPLESASEVSVVLNRRKDGSTFPAETSASDIINEAGTVLGRVVVARDLTVLERAEKEKQLLQIQLEQSERLRTIGQVAGGIVHDFNNILGSVLGFAELVLFDLKEGSIAYANQQQVMTAANRAKDLAQQILKLGRPEPLQESLTDVNAVVEEVLQLTRAMAPSTIEVVRNLSPAEPVVRCDKGKLGQAVMNLCTNAFHAMGRGPGRLTVEVVLSPSGPEGSEPGERVRITVTDTGHGIEPKLLAKIFDPFFSTKKEGEGTGLGLSVVAEIIRGAGGEIDVESEVGKGTACHLYLPPAAVSSEVRAAPAGPVPRAGKARVLFVEDEEPLAEVGALMLQRLGYDVVVKADGAAGLEVFLSDAQAFDVVVSDQSMPRMSGEALAEEVWKIRPDVPVLLVSGYRSGRPVDRREAERYCVYLTKPVGLNQLGQALTEALELAGGRKSA